MTSRLWDNGDGSVMSHKGRFCLTHFPRKMSQTEPSPETHQTEPSLFYAPFMIIDPFFVFYVTLCYLPARRVKKRSGICWTLEMARAIANADIKQLRILIRALGVEPVINK